MEELVPATGRVLRYWYKSLSHHCKCRLYDYLGVEPIRQHDHQGGDHDGWSSSEVWHRPEIDPDATIVLEQPVQLSRVPTLRKRVVAGQQGFARPDNRRRGAVLHTTFGETRSRMKGGRCGISMISPI